MTLQEALDYLHQATSKKGYLWDAIATESTSISVEVFKGKTKLIENSSSCGIGLRLFHQGRCGTSWTESLSPDALQGCLDMALSNATVSESLDLLLSPKSEIESNDPQQWNEALNKISSQDLKDYALEMETTALDYHSDIQNVTHSSAYLSKHHAFLTNSNGLLYQSRSNRIGAGIATVAERDGQKKMGSYSNASRQFETLNPKTMGKKAAERSLELLGAQSMPSNTLPVLFSNRVSSQLIGMYSSIFNAELVQKGQSRLENKLQQQIASPHIHLRCLPNIPGAPGSRRLDAEGTPCQPLDIISEGKLMNMIYHIESAQKDQVVPTGHASRGLKGKVGVSFSNLHLDLGKASREELLNSETDVIEVLKLEGGAACSAISGELSIGIQGLLHQKGQSPRPFDRCTLSGNFFDLLLNIKACSNSYSDTFSSIKVPDLLVSGLSIGGEGR